MLMTTMMTAMVMVIDIRVITQKTMVPVINIMMMMVV